MFKPHYGICTCHNQKRLIVVKAGYCKEGNEEKKRANKVPKPIKPKVFKPIPKKSEKRKRLEEAYSILRGAYLKNHPFCEAKIQGVCSKEAQDIHHLYSGKDREKHLNDFSNVMAVCRFCHTHIHSVLSAEEARELGFKK